MKRLRLFWWSRVRRYCCELCDVCGRPTGVTANNEPKTWWHTPDDLWAQVTGRDGPGRTDHEPNLLCIRCFTLLADRQGRFVRWHAEADRP